MKLHRRKSWLVAITFALILLVILAFLFINHHDKALTASVEDPHKIIYEPQDSGMDSVLENSHRHNQALSTDNLKVWDSNSPSEGDEVRRLVTAANNPPLSG